MPAARDPWEVIQHRSFRDGECWLWEGSRCQDGYGKMNSRKFPGETLAHRIAYQLMHGPIPRGMEIDHLCNRRACVNPDHLRAVPHMENVRRADYTVNHRNGRKTHCMRGHELVGGNVYVNPGSGARRCMVCRRLLRRGVALPGNQGLVTAFGYSEIRLRET